MRLNIVGVGRFTISLFGEAKLAVRYNREKKKAYFASVEKQIVQKYLEDLKFLAQKYNDEYFLTFVDDFKNSTLYIETFNKSVKLAKLRNVPENKILKNDLDIDRRFWGETYDW